MTIEEELRDAGRSVVAAMDADYLPLYDARLAEPHEPEAPSGVLDPESPDCGVPWVDALLEIVRNADVLKPTLLHVLDDIRVHLSAANSVAVEAVQLTGTLAALRVAWQTVLGRRFPGGWGPNESEAIDRLFGEWLKRTLEREGGADAQVEQDPTRQETQERDRHNQA